MCFFVNLWQNKWVTCLLHLVISCIFKLFRDFPSWCIGQANTELYSNHISDFRYIINTWEWLVLVLNSDFEGTLSKKRPPNYPVKLLLEHLCNEASLSSKQSASSTITTTSTTIIIIAPTTTTTTYWCLHHYLRNTFVVVRLLAAGCSLHPRFFARWTHENKRRSRKD